MTVAGAATIFGVLPGAASAASLVLPSELVTQTKRAGQQLLEVGPNFIRSYSSRNCCSVTARSVHALAVRAVRNMVSRAKPSLAYPVVSADHHMLRSAIVGHVLGASNAPIRRRWAASTETEQCLKGRSRFP